MGAAIAHRANTRVNSLRLQTERLLLVPANLELALAESGDRKKFSELLDADIPSNWPPPLNDEQSHQWVIKFFKANPGAVGWSLWYFLLDRSGERRLAIGNGGLKGLPSPDGTAEVGYSIIPEYQRQGYAPEATKALVAWTFGHPQVTRVIAHTLPELQPSIRVMEKNGFTFTGAGEEPGTIGYELKREDWERRLEKEDLN
jgi:ribosomal-protein-alanine N-acetyltransferase